MKLAKNVFSFGMLLNFSLFSAPSVDAEDGVIAIEEVKREDKVDFEKEIHN